MSQYYNPNRIKNLYNSDSKELFHLSRSKIDLFINCPRCFYLDRKLVDCSNLRKIAAKLSRVVGKEILPVHLSALKEGD